MVLLYLVALAVPSSCTTTAPELARRTNGNGTQVDLTYDGIGAANGMNDFGAGRVVQARHTVTSGGAELDKHTFEWDRDGNKTRRVDARTVGATDDYTHAYDGLSRMTARTPDSGSAASFTYDATGNRTVTGYALEGADALVHAYTKTPVDSRGYDRLGNTATFNAREFWYTFDAQSRLTSVTVAGTRVEDDFSTLPAAYSVVSGTWAVSGEVLSETTGVTGRILRDLAEDTTEATFSFKSPHDAEDTSDYDPERYGLFIVRLFESTWRYAALVIEPTGLYLREWDDDVLVGQLDSETAAFQSDTWYDVKVTYTGTDRRDIDVYWAKRGDPMPTSTTFGGTLSANLAEATDQQTGFGTGELGDYSYRDVQFRDVSSTSSTMTSTYLYDALGRRIGKTTDLDTTPVAVQYIYDGNQIVEERDGSGNLNASYVHGIGVDEPITMTRGANTYYYHQDDQGNVVALTDASAAVAERYTYGTFGDPSIFEADGTTPRTASIAQNAFLFTGREWDPELSAYWYRTRYMDPKAGRFINRDTIGLWGDAANLGNPYSYVNNNPWSRTDPYGQWGWDDDWLQTSLNVLGGGFFSNSGGAAMHSFWVVSGGEQLSEMASGAMAMGSASAWTGAYNTAVEDTAAHYEQRIATHVAVNGGNVEEAIGTATGWRMVGADIVGFTSMGEARNRLDYTTGAPLAGIERVQRGLTGVSQFTGSVAFIGGTGSSLAQGYKGVGLPRFAPRTGTTSVTTQTAAENTIWRVGRHGDMPSPRSPGSQSHHGVNSVWMEANVPGYSAADAPAILMRNRPFHDATRGVFNRVRSEIATRQGVSVRNIDWARVPPGTAWRLAEEQLQAAQVPANIRAEYFRQFNQYLDTLR